MQLSQWWTRLLLLTLSIATTEGVANARPAAMSPTGPAARQASTPSQQVHFVELLWLQPKATPEAAADYFKNKLRPILSKHGGEILQGYQVVATVQGDLKPAWINVIRFRSMEDMQAIFQDPDYTKIVPLRDAIFNLTQHPFFSVLPVSR